jgi:hypothetical protein
MVMPAPAPSCAGELHSAGTIPAESAFPRSDHSANMPVSLEVPVLRVGVTPKAGGCRHRHAIKLYVCSIPEHFLGVIFDVFKRKL